LVGRVHDPLGIAEGRTQRGQIRATDRVDQHDARTLAAQLHEVGPMPVAVARRALGIDRDRPGAGAQPGDGLAESFVVVDDPGHAVAQLEQRGKFGRGFSLGPRVWFGCGDGVGRLEARFEEHRGDTEIGHVTTVRLAGAIMQKGAAPDNRSRPFLRDQRVGGPAFR
jgi:hypothetical protein